MTQIARIRDNTSERRLQAERLIGARALQEAQALRFSVFSEEFNARLNGAEQGLDIDDYDVHCSHIGVRDLNTLVNLQGPILELGRTCVDPTYRNGGTIAVLWSELAEVLNEGGYSYLMGCASIPMQDGGIQAHAIMQRLRERYLCNEHLRAEPKNPLPTLDIPSNVICEMPPLLKAYMRLGAKICGEPCWDEDFQVADVFILLKRDDLCPRYARHFKAAV
ncbi:GNAT family N-acetyltransferase [Pseudomonas syringae]|nr:GNAT family N-acyltransferase [Pseudomonas syringae]MDP5166793.1 GNAT family N-acyltransferase [Pseudomonas syringae pv. aptata str. DSM 50252]